MKDPTMANDSDKIGNTDPASVPAESHGGNNARNAPKPVRKDGNGAQKRQQQKKTN
jgi:hypothetical protein